MLALKEMAKKQSVLGRLAKRNMALEAPCQAFGLYAVFKNHSNKTTNLSFYGLLY